MTKCRSVSQCVVATGLIALFVGGQGVAHAEKVPLPNKGYASITGPAGPGQNVGVTVKEEPGNPHPTGVEMSSTALDKGNALGDTDAAWVGSGRILPNAKPGTYKVKFTLTYEGARCMNEADRDSVCDYDPTVLWSEVKVEATGERQADGWGLWQGAALGAAAATLAAVGVISVRRRAARSSRPS
ncbi:hypothetical protein OG735_41135 (plasmid) [Streptomyces sp. NBC_01210]|uniref:hypothetical protein n=1 Tax=Streptomyces sp. NBC_01210 TaxID=2903774 RepID=UPI002E0D46C4|nr:hypothetical protein OG735_41135 [Streptomyces sp. NBC_01210]